MSPDLELCAVVGESADRLLCSESILELLRQMVELRLAHWVPHSLLNFPKRWAERGKPDEVVAIWSKKLMEDENRLFANAPG